MRLQADDVDADSQHALVKLIFAELLSVLPVATVQLGGSSERDLELVLLRLVFVVSQG